MSKKKSELFQSVTFPEAGQHMTALQKAKQLQVHPETVIRNAATLGGTRIGRSWRFPWQVTERVARDAQVAEARPLHQPQQSISFGTTGRLNAHRRKRLMEELLRPTRRSRNKRLARS